MNPVLKDLPSPDCHYLSAALGWAGLGNLEEAEAELDKVSKDNRRNRDILSLIWDIKGKNNKWEQSVNIAEELIAVEPEIPDGWIYRSFSLHELQRTDEAWENLIMVADRFNDNWTIPYNLACYACQLDQLADAQEWIVRAMKIEGVETIRERSMEDPDLTPLQDIIRTLKP